MPILLEWTVFIFSDRDTPKRNAFLAKWAAQQWRWVKWCGGRLLQRVRLIGATKEYYG